MHYEHVSSHHRVHTDGVGGASSIIWSFTLIDIITHLKKCTLIHNHTLCTLFARHAIKQWLCIKISVANGPFFELSELCVTTYDVHTMALVECYILTLHFT